MKKIHLTFDDGPHSTNTPSVLDTLKRHNIKATFFVIGNRVKKHSEIIERILGEGHRIGNHTYDHPRLTGLSKSEVIKQISKTENELLPYQEPDKIFRPPYGAHDALVDKTISELGYHQVLWTVDTEDWKRKPDGWVEYGIEQIKKREHSVILMHDIHVTTAENLEKFINRIKSLGDIIFENPKDLITPPKDCEVYYTVVRGDTLSSISRKFYGTPSKYIIIYEANKDILTSPDKIHPGQVLLIPFDTTPR